MVTYEEIAEYAFIAFVIVAIVAGLAVGYMAWPDSGIDPIVVADARTYVTLIMLILGIIVGLISITAKEVTPFLIAAIALAVVRTDVWSPLSRIHYLLYYWAHDIVSFIVAFVAPAAVIIAIRSVYALAKKK